ncbi:hypothetical protein UFOVP1204_3 [uncultured Caudovirales phage]|uniref:Uncharacterized protein n=1 Tax=uncultured Caudovirales phage TaxID=2100421 RepID=A0A6J5QXT9_9CAUD|nr:hypothetical protein UFOVP473_24 [uncultured Caudovirales phage]CAB4176427.1 hypothetical protein UFOVP983_24 [uncultured Caudovirales phage]CAB4189470.1 hypothetical protein UFOVP1204_3 [uncultured Caudovirales phage]
MNPEDDDDQMQGLAPDETPDDDGGSLIDIQGDDDGVEDTKDGGALVTVDDETEVDEDPEHFANLAETLPETELNELASELLEVIDRDKEARAKRDKQYEEGLDRTGMGEPAKGGADFDGASRVTHPMLTEAAVDFSARVMKELFPPNGPVKDHVLGNVTQQKLDKAKRKTAYMNWQLTKQMKEFRSELEQCLTQVPLGGAQYIKMYWSGKLNRPVAETIYIDDMILPYAASNYLTAERKTHVQRLTEAKFRDRVKIGMYVDVDMAGEIGMVPEETAAGKRNDSIEGRESDPYNVDGLRTIYETSVILDLEEEGDFAPYLVSVDDTSRKVLAIYRNWEPSDETREAMEWAAEFPCLPWRGAYPIGLIQLVGGLSAAATGALRALLDSAHINNAATAIKLAGGSKGGQTVNPNVGEIVEIEGAMMTDDIRKTVMPLPFNPPSAVLFQLLGFLTDAGKSVIQTSFEKMSDQNQNMPVGTTLALIEQGMTVFSEIHGRMHRAMEQLLGILHRINKQHMKDSATVEELGELMAKRTDFEGPLDVVPVSDPNIFSEMQRIAQIQMVAQRSAAVPGLYDQRKVEELILDRTKIPNARDLLLPKPDPKQLNAVNENVAATMGKPVMAFPEQDHMAHLKTHVLYMQNPIFGGNPIVGKRAMPILLQHLAEHLAFLYLSDSYDLASQAAGGPVEKLMDVKDSEVDQGVDQLMGMASEQALKTIQGDLGQQLPPIIQQAIQFIQQFQPPPPIDPATVASKDVERRTAADQVKAQVDAGKLELDKAKETRLAGESALEAQSEQNRDEAALKLKSVEIMGQQQTAQDRMQTDLERQHMANVSRETTNAADNETAKQIAAAELMVKGATNMETGTGINPQ